MRKNRARPWTLVALLGCLAAACQPGPHAPLPERPAPLRAIDGPVVLPVPTPQASTRSPEVTSPADPLAQVRIDQYRSRTWIWITLPALILVSVLLLL